VQRDTIYHSATTCYKPDKEMAALISTIAAGFLQVAWRNVHSQLGSYSCMQTASLSSCAACLQKKLLTTPHQ
jgi:hypothetical protein